jgi:hypothetical protein
MNALLSGFRDVRALAELGEPFDHDTLRALLARVPEVGPSMSQDELRELSGEVERIIALATERQDDINAQLTELYRGRSAIQGYNHLQALHKAQRLSKRA